MLYPTNECKDSEYEGVHIRQYSDMCYTLTTDPKGVDSFNAAEHLNADITFITEDTFMIQTSDGVGACDEWSKLFKAINHVIEVNTNGHKSS